MACHRNRAMLWLGQLSLTARACTIDPTTPTQVLCRACWAPTVMSTYAIGWTGVLGTALAYATAATNSAKHTVGEFYRLLRRVGFSCGICKSKAPRPQAGATRQPHTQRTPQAPKAKLPKHAPSTCSKQTTATQATCHHHCTITTASS